MATKIVTKNSSTASAVPTASDLVQGELAVNVADKRLFTEDNGGAIVELGTKPSTIDINAGTIDGTAIGASSASTGAFTTLTATGLTVDTDTLAVDSTNNRVGIGTASPNRSLETNSTQQVVASFKSTSTDSARISFSDANTTDDTKVTIGSTGDALKINTLGSERMRIDSSGNVGIGTSSPSALLDVQLGTTGTIAEFRGADTDLLNIDGDTNAITLDARNVASLNFEMQGSEAMRIDSSGNVGIGTSSPDSKLDVSHGSSGEIARFTSPNSTSSYITIGRDGSTSEGFTAGYNSSNGDCTLTALAASHPIIFKQSTSERMRLDSSGNLLVGTSSSPASTNPKTLRYGVGVQAGSISTVTPATAGVVTTMLNMAGVTGSSQSGAGMYLVTLVRDGGSYGTHFVGIYGVNSSSIVLYEVLHSNGMTVSVSGTSIRANVANTDTYNCNAIPLSIYK